MAISLIGDKPNSLEELTNAIRNPFEKSVDKPFRGEDFTSGFLIEELTGPKVKISLVGNMMPKIPFTFGGEQRIKKDYYAGNSEPVTQVLGSKETDVTINGTLKDKKYKDNKFYGVSTEIQQQIDAVRIRGNLCRFVLGEWERYGYIQRTVFKMNKLSYVDYDITFLIAGFNAPKNAVFLQKQKLIPFDINQALIAEALKFEALRNSIPDSVPQSLSDVLTGFIDDVAREIKKVTDFVDQIIDTVDDIQKSIGRILGLIKNVQNKIREYSNFLSKINPFDDAGGVPTGITSAASGLTSKYKEASYYASSIAGLGFLAALMNRYRDQFKAIADDTPLGRHIVKAGDNLQKISTKFYDTADNWKDILEYNSLDSTNLVVGTILEIPRL